MDQAFSATKWALVAAAELKNPKADFPISLMVKASNTHVAAVLQHFHPLILGPALPLLLEADAG